MKRQMQGHGSDPRGRIEDELRRRQVRRPLSTRFAFAVLRRQLREPLILRMMVGKPALVIVRRADRIADVELEWMLETLAWEATELLCGPDAEDVGEVRRYSRGEDAGDDSRAILSIYGREALSHSAPALISFEDKKPMPRPQAAEVAADAALDLLEGIDRTAILSALMPDASGLKAEDAPLMRWADGLANALRAEPGFPWLPLADAAWARLLSFDGFVADLDAAAAKLGRAPLWPSMPLRRPDNVVAFRPRSSANA